MTEHKAIRNKDRSPSHPGAAIDDILIDVRVAKTQVAEKLGISRQHLHEILSGNKPLSASVAVKVAALFGGSAESWLRMQATYDAWHAAREIDVSGIKRLDVA
jgi:antitoxin HigA-1